MRCLNLIFNILSQLISKVIKNNKEKRTLKKIFTFNYTLIELKNNFKVKLKEVYNQDENWKKILNFLFKEESQELPFKNKT